jgi:arginine exporter protein ArgO
METVAYVSAIVIASASWHLLLAGAGATLGRVLTGKRGRLITAVVSGILITTLAARTVRPD